jgi:hypothetical protein
MTSTVNWSRPFPRRLRRCRRNLHKTVNKPARNRQIDALPSTLIHSESDCSDVDFSLGGGRTASGYTVGRCRASSANPPIELNTCKALLKGCCWYILESTSLVSLFLSPSENRQCNSGILKYKLQKTSIQARI